MALCKPSTELDDGGTYKASKGQRWLYGCWESLLETVEQKRQGNLYTILNGDIAEGDVKDRSLQLVTRNTATITRMASDLLEPLNRMSTALFSIRGTAAHGGKSGSFEEQIADDLEAVPCPDTGARSWWSMRWVSEKVRFDIAHKPKGGAGGRPYNRHGFIDRLAADAEFEYTERGEPLPHLVIRSHVHKYFDSENRFKVRAITTPAFTLSTEYIVSLDPQSLAHIGAILVYCSAGALEVKPIIYKPAPNRYFTGRMIRENHRE